jgi:hypothetical protein
MIVLDPSQHDIHKIYWILGIIGTVGAGASVLAAMFKWGMGVYEKACHTVAQINSIPTLGTAAQLRDEQTAATLKRVQEAVELTNTNHLTHIQKDITEGRAEQTKLMERIAEAGVNMDTNIKILVDRGIRL